MMCYEEQGRGGEGRAVASKWQEGKDDTQCQEGGLPIPIQSPQADHGIPQTIADES